MDYKISVEEKGEITRNISIEIPRAVFNRRFDSVLAQTTGRVRLKGFRPGRAPKAMVAKLYGTQIHSDVLSEFVSAAYRDAVTQHSLKVVGQPEINIEDANAEDDVKITAAVAVYPEPEIGNFRGLSFEAEAEEFSPELVTERIDGFREQHSKLEQVTGRNGVVATDIVKVDLSGTVDGAPFEGSVRKDHFLELGKETMFPGVEDVLVGAKVGETKTAQFAVPEGSPAELEGKLADYTIVVTGIFERVIPELTVEMVKETGVAEDIDGFKKFVADQLEKEITQKNEMQREESLFRKLIELNEFEVPQALLDQEIRSILMEMKFLDPSKEESYRVNVEAFRDGLGKSAEFRVRRAIILSKIIEQEKITAEDSEVDTWLDTVAERHGRTREDINRVYGFPKNTSQLKDMVISEKMVRTMLDSATITVTKRAAVEEQV